MRRTRTTLLVVFLLPACVSDPADKGDDSDPTPDPIGTADGGTPMGSDPDAMPSGGSLSFMDPCDLENDMCDMEEGLFCFGFNNRGPHCTKPCELPEDCEAPSRGCNGMGVCKSPE